MVFDAYDSYPFREPFKSRVTLSHFSSAIVFEESAV